jgi:type VI secretion system protein ImpH
MNAPPDGAVVDDLLANGRSFTFFQAMRLLERLSARAGADDRAGKRRVRVRPTISMGFPSADIDRIEAVDTDDGAGYRMTATFLGLYGSSSPLPTFYSEDLIEEAGNDESVSRDFLDIFHQRLYDIFYRCLGKYRLFLQVAENKDESVIERLYCLLGLGPEGIRRSVPHAGMLLRYIGLFTQYPRSAAGLTTLLHDVLPDVPIELTPCIRRMAKIPVSQRTALGVPGVRLGSSSYLGEEIEDRMGKFRISVGPLDQAGFLRFTPGNPGHGLVVALTEHYLTEPLEYEIELILAANQARTASLGDPVRSVLGVTTWVFSQAELGEVRTRFAVNRS